MDRSLFGAKEDLLAVSCSKFMDVGSL